MPARVRRKCFVSYHQQDLAQVNRFISRFGSRNFIKRGIMVPDDVIASNRTDYVLRRIRELYLRDSTVTIVLIGARVQRARLIQNPVGRFTYNRRCP
jgi:hypothetical protein